MAEKFDAADVAWTTSSSATITHILIGDRVYECSKDLAERHTALLERVTVLERALERLRAELSPAIVEARFDTSTYEDWLKRLDSIALKALDGS